MPYAGGYRAWFQRMVDGEDPEAALEQALTPPRRVSPRR